jgi:transaldolase
MTANANPLARLADHGQSLWLDDIRRSMLHDGELERMINEDGLRGMTSNPAIFEKAISKSADYDAQLRSLVEEGLDVAAVYESLAIADIARAAELLRRVYDSSDTLDGYISLEVAPQLARDTEATLDEARRLWTRLQQPNVMIKVPATREGLPAIRQLIAEGINVNVTLLFSLSRYVEVADAFVAGLEDRLEAGKSIEGIASVASFFLSRIDTLVDDKLDLLGAEEAVALRGEAAIASANLAYTHYCQLVGSARWKRLAEAGAAPQRLLWASTSAKDPAYDALKYVEPLIGPDTVTTLPRETLQAYREHGDPKSRLSPGAEKAKRTVALLAEAGIDLEAVAEQLEAEGIDKFLTPFEALFAALERRMVELRRS